MRKQKQTKEEREQKPKKKSEESTRPVEKSDLDALLEFFGQTKNLPK